MNIVDEMLMLREKLTQLQARLDAAEEVCLAVEKKHTMAAIQFKWRMYHQVVLNQFSAHKASLDVALERGMDEAEAPVAIHPNTHPSELEEFVSPNIEPITPEEEAFYNIQSTVEIKEYVHTPPTKEA